MFSAILLLSAIITTVKIAKLEIDMNNNIRCSNMDLKLKKFIKSFEYKQRIFQIYMYYSGFFSLLTLICYSKRLWTIVIYVFWFLGNISFKILNIINAGFYYKSIKGAITETCIWLPYFIVTFLNGYNKYKIEGLENYLEESLKLPYN